MNNKELQVTSNNPIVNSVEKRINELQKTDSIHFPKNYSPQNALISAMLTLKEIQTRDKKPVLTACSKESIQNSLLTMVAQGLSPAKNQGYFIAYGSKLKFMRSYFGTMAVAKRMADIKDITAELVHKSDTFEFDIINGKKAITKHTTKLDAIDEDFVAVYCIVTFGNGEKYTEIMTKKQIMISWSKAKTQNVQKEFPDQMAKRTVINRACKYFINTSDDSDVLVKSFNDSGGEIEEVITDESGTQKITHRGEVEMEVEVDSEEKKDTKPTPPKQKPKSKPAKVVEREEPKPENKMSEVMVFQKKLLEKIDVEFKAERMSQKTFNLLVETVSQAENSGSCHLIDSQCMLLSQVSTLESDLKIPPSEIGEWNMKILGATTLEETAMLRDNLGKIK